MFNQFNLPDKVFSPMDVLSYHIPGYLRFSAPKFHTNVLVPIPYTFMTQPHPMRYMYVHFSFLATLRSIKVAIFGSFWKQNIAKNGKNVTQVLYRWTA